MGRDDRHLEGRRRRFLLRPSRAHSNTSRSIWRPRSPMPPPTTRCGPWRTSRRRAASPHSSRRQGRAAEVFAVIAEEIGRLARGRFNRGDAPLPGRLRRGIRGRLGLPRPSVAGRNARVPLGGRNVASLVFRTGRAARLDDYYESASGPIAERLEGRRARARPWQSRIVVAGWPWG